jgi:hypothetical protein
MTKNDDAALAEIEEVRKAVLSIMGDLVPAGPPASADESKRFFLSSWTKASRDLPPHYLVHFLLIGLLKYPHLGQWEKTAWALPVRLGGKLYGVEHRKMGVGVFAPNPDPSAARSSRPTEAEEADAREIVRRIRRAVDVAAPYFEWRANTAAKGRNINVVNRSAVLFERYRFFCKQFDALTAQASSRKEETVAPEDIVSDHKLRLSHMFPAIRLLEEAEWSAQAAIEAFFSWTEHVFIHLAILQGTIQTGDEVANLAEADWKAKYKAALDISNVKAKRHYDSLIALRTQIRNFMAHGAFGKSGEAFSFHSGAGAVPVLLTRSPKHRYALTGTPAFDEKSALQELESFVAYLWSGPRAPARECLDSDLPTVLTFASDGTYSDAMESVDTMIKFVRRRLDEQERVANMDW